MRLSPVLRAAAAVVVGSLLAVPGPAEAADPFACAEDVSTGTDPGQSRVESKPLRAMDVEAATERLAAQGREPGEGVKVAVLDSGVLATSPYAPIEVEHPPTYAGVGGALEYSHGTIVASLVAAHAQDDGLPVGVAPAATVVDLPVYRSVATSTTGGPGRGIEVPDVVAALDWLDQHAREDRIKVVVIALELDGTPALKAAIHRLADPSNDVVIVAASGNRPSEGEGSTGSFAGTPKPGEDARDVIFPAGYTRDVLAVTSTGAGLRTEGGQYPDPTGTVLFNSATDLALPTIGAVAVDGIGTTCVLTDAQTSWAAGLAGGVVALLRSAFPHETAAQIQTRLLETADGRYGQTDRLYGAGTVQPVEALTRVMQMTRSGKLEATTTEDRSVPPVRAPEPAPDPLTGIRHDSVWWGLVGGAALVVTALVRPILARRRRHTG